MALISCPECGGQVSDRAPSCPHCGVPIAAVPTAPAAAVPSSDADAAKPLVESELTPHIQAHQPFKPRIAGRAVPVAALLFWGGMVLGVIQNFVFQTPAGSDSPLRMAAFVMIFTGILWFAVTEGIAALRSYRARQRDD